MEPILISIAHIIATTATTQRGRETLMELCAGIQTYVAVKTPAVVDEAAAAVAPPAAPAVPEAPPAAAAPPAVAEAPAPIRRPITFPGSYNIIKDVVAKVANDMEAINNITDIDKRFAEINSLYKYIVYTVPGILLFSNLQEIVTSKIDTYITQLQTTYKNIPESKKYLGNFGLMKYSMSYPMTVRFSWYEDDTRITVVQTNTGTFKEIRRGDLTGRKLTDPRYWDDFKSLKQFWADHSLTNSEIATTYA